MEQILAEAQMSEMPAPKAEKVLELNPEHPVFSILQKLHSEENSSERLKNYASLLYNQALMMEGLPIENPADFASQITSLMINNTQKD